MEILAYLAFIFMGLSLSMLGGGGSILTVPILVYLLKIEPTLATSYSLFIVGLSALMGGVSYLRRREVDFKTGIIFALPSFLGVYTARAILVPMLPPTILSVGTMVLTKPVFMMGAFASLMLFAARSMIKGRKTQEPSEGENLKERNYLLIAVQGLMVGSLTGFVGAGGGFLIIPALVVMVGLPMKRAVGTSLFIIAANSTVGFLGGLRHIEHVDWVLLLSSVGVAFLGLLLGFRLLPHVSDKALKKAFGYFTLLLGAIILFDQLTKL